MKHNALSKMSKKLITLFFSILFWGLISAPTIITVLDESIDVSMFYNSLEEEEENSIEIVKEIKLITYDSQLQLDINFFNNEKINVAYHIKSYSKPFINLVFPPPEQNIL